MELLPFQSFFLSLKDFKKVMREDGCRHADSDSHCSLNDNYRNLSREKHRLFVPAIIGIHILCYLRVIKDLLRKWLQAAFNIPCSRCTITCEEVTVVSLLFNEKL